MGEPLKGKLRFKDEDDLAEYACDEIFKCSGEQPTESDPTGCTGCDAQEEWFDKHYSDMVIDESEDKQFASKEDIKSAVEWLKGKVKERRTSWEKVPVNEKGKVMQIGITNMLDIVGHLIDQAFPDLNTDNSKKENKKK